VQNFAQVGFSIVCADIADFEWGNIHGIFKNQVQEVAA
jgi:hypothetical protein